MDTLPGDKKDSKVMQSTISRFACRILVDRNEPNRARIFAAGFDSSRNIFLGVSSSSSLSFVQLYSAIGPDWRYFVNEQNKKSVINIFALQ